MKPNMKKIIAVALVVVVLMTVVIAEGASLLGGWTNSTTPEVTEELNAVLEKGVEGLLGAQYTPVAYLGSQVVSGTNHCYLCQITPVVPNAEPHYALVYLYENLEGEVQLVNVVDLDLGEFYDYGAEEIEDAEVGE